jgi:predicted NUDIX family NTP pyrophosphohydrolase
MPRISAGLLVYRRPEERIEVFLVHPGGPYWARKDDGAWSIPKGEPNDGEALLVAARREFNEETGQAPPAGEPRALDPVRQPTGKVIHAWMVEGDLDASAVTSNLMAIEWPPRSGRRVEFPEVDRAAWFDLDQARRKILPGQRPLLEQLARQLAPR